jgi:hypothetical protein
MKTQEYKGKEERRVLIGMITDQVVCSRVASQWPEDGGLFASEWSNMVARWCIGHLAKYGEPPNGELVGIFERWAAKSQASDEMVKSVEGLLNAMDDEHDLDNPPSTDCLLDLAQEHFNSVRLDAALEEAKDKLYRGTSTQAWSKLKGLVKVEMGHKELVKPAEDYELIVKAFDPEQQEQLVHYPGKLDDLLGKELVSDSFIAFMGPEKSGKSMWLLDLAFRACQRGRHRVAFFEVGDMGRDAVLRRLGQRATGLPRKEGSYKIPLSVDDDGNVEHQSKRKKAATPGVVYKQLQKSMNKKDVFRLSCHSNSTVNVADIRSILATWERESGWTPAVICIDYADILAPPTGYNETLDQIDHAWKELRRMSQDLHCLVATATQSNAASYRDGTGTLTRRHFSGRKTKLAHCNGMLGLNVSPEDKRKGVTRVNWVVLREGEFNDRRGMPVAGCMAICNPSMKS